MNQPPFISGFTIVRNAELLYYPFKEAVCSVMPLCDEFVINCGRSEDRTLELCKELQDQFPSKISILQTDWVAESFEGGFQLRAQTDRAIEECKGRWCFYIQADEAIHEEDLENIKLAISRADSNPEVDGIVFSYTHFYGDYRWTIQGRNWYRREVRCFKNGRGIKAFRDAQGFRRNGVRLKAVPSNARVFHYGYVRNSHGLKTKAREMGRWWASAPSLKDCDYRLIHHIGLSRFNQTHPSVMRERIEKHGVRFEPTSAPRKWDAREIKNLITILWERLTGFRIGEFRNYDFVR